MPDQNEVSDRASKFVARRQARARRAAVDDRASRIATIAERVLALPELERAAAVLAYRAVGTEVSVVDVVTACEAAGRTVVLPDAAPDAIPPAGLDLVDAVLVPGLAFTARGDRLGQGGGWYDRVLPRLRPDCAVIAVAFDAQVVDTLPTDDHDVPVDVVVTESAVHRRSAPTTSGGP